MTNIEELEKTVDTQRRILTKAQHENLQLNTKIAELEVQLEHKNELFDNAIQAACETQPTWKYRCHRILEELGQDFGDPDWMMPDDIRRMEEAEAIVERVRNVQKRNCFDVAADTTDDHSDMWIRNDDLNKALYNCNREGHLAVICSSDGVPCMGEHDGTEITICHYCGEQLDD